MRARSRGVLGSGAEAGAAVVAAGGGGPEAAVAGLVDVELAGAGPTEAESEPAAGLLMGAHVIP